jgi:hypothetical protein
MKMSKSLDMRFHWLRDRIQQGHFRVLFIPGAVNIADFFTKALPVHRHCALAPYSAVDPDDDAYEPGAHDRQSALPLPPKPALHGQFVLLSNAICEAVAIAWKSTVTSASDASVSIR